MDLLGGGAERISVVSVAGAKSTWRPHGTRQNPEHDPDPTGRDSRIGPEIVLEPVSAEPPADARRACPTSTVAGTRPRRDSVAFGLYKFAELLNGGPP